MTPRVRYYVAEAAAWHGVEAEAIVGRSRRRKHCLARAHVMRWLRRDGFSTVQIGRWLGRDHSTVTHWTAEGRRERVRDRRACVQPSEETVEGNPPVLTSARPCSTPPVRSIESEMEPRATNCACGKQLDPRNRVGKCRSCYFRASATDPVMIAKRTASLRMYVASPQGRSARRNNPRIAWCPVEYRDEYRRLLYTHHFPAETARAMIAELIEADAARYARTGQLQQSRRAG